MPCPPLEVSTLPLTRSLTYPLQEPPQPGVGHKMKAPVQPLRGPWDKYSPQEVEETNSTKRQESPPGDEARSGQVAHTIRRPLPKTGGDRLGGFFFSAFEVDIF